MLFKAKYRGATIAGADVKAAIIAALVARFKEYDLGGYSQVAGAGVIYVTDLRGTVERAHPAIVNATLSSPSADVAIALGHQAVLIASTGTETGQ